MASSTDVAICVVFCGLLVLAGRNAFGAKKGEKPDPARDAVEKVLLREADSAVDRRAELAKALRRQPESELLRWQTGYVRVGKEWRSVEDVTESTADAEKFGEYRRRRDQAAVTAAGQLELANWCRKSGLRDQERAHLLSAHYLSPGQEEPSVCARLGYRQVGNHWLSQDQFGEWRDTNQRALAAVKKWEPQLAKIAEQAKAVGKVRDGALMSLQRMATPAAIPAIEYVLCGANEPAAHLAVEAFCDIPEYEGTVAIAKQAVFSKWASIRGEAGNSLRYRELDQFVPTLVRLLETPAKSFSATPRLYLRSEDSQTGQFALIASYVVARETDDQFRVSVLNTVDFRLNERLLGMPTRALTVRNQAIRGGEATAIQWTEALSLTLLRSELDIRRDVEGDEHRRAKELSDANERTNELNSRIIAVLATVSGRAASPEPSSWWQWWEEQSDTESPAIKPVVATSKDEILGDPTSWVSRAAHSSCFAAGTRVWTARGRIPIERIGVGDSVLSQDVETGELAYQPVVATSVRKPRELVQLEIGKETVTSTGGHRYWVSGKGWVKARDLFPESRLHTVTGNASLLSTKAAPAAKTYNLVVADSHSYFVGETGLLVQDLPMPRSTNRIVPGLTRSRLAEGEPRQ